MGRRSARPGRRISRRNVREFGFYPSFPEPFEALSAAHLFFQLVLRHCERGSILITSNRSVGEWGGVFGDSPQLNPMERVWLYLRERFLSLRLLEGYM